MNNANANYFMVSESLGLLNRTFAKEENRRKTVLLDYLLVWILQNSVWEHGAHGLNYQWTQAKPQNSARTQPKHSESNFCYTQAPWVPAEYLPEILTHTHICWTICALICNWQCQNPSEGLSQDHLLPTICVYITQYTQCLQQGCRDGMPVTRM